MSMFGASSTTPATGTSIFGTNNASSNTNQPAGGSMFGGFGQNANPNTTQQQPGTSIFGAPLNNANANTQQTQQPASNPLFGGTNTNSAAGTSLGTGTGTSIFGNAAPTTSLFGKSTTPTPAPGNTGTSLFGGANTNPAAGTNPLFGGNNQQPAGTGTSNFFATPPAGQQQQQQQPQQNNQPKPSIFGTTSTNPLFGGSTTNTTGNNGTGSIFGGGSTSNNPNPLLGGSTNGIAGTGTSSLFGNTTAPTNAGGNTLGASLFSGGNSTLGGSSVFGTSRPSSGLGVSSLGAPNQGSDAQAQFARLQEKIESIVGAWNAQNPSSCRFQHYFYNLVDPAQISLYTRPPNAVNEALWQKAVRENPDPTCLVPVLALGFDDLRDRVNAQGTQSVNHKEKLLELQKKLQTLTTNHSTVTVPRLQRYSALQTQLMHRLLRLVQHLHLLIPSVRSSAIGEGEEALRGALEEVVAEVGVSGSSNTGSTDGSGKGGRIKSKLGELWAVVGALKAREESLNAVVGGSGEWKVVDEEGLSRITQILAEQQAGLAHLTKILQKDLKDLAIVMGTAGSSVIAEGNESENVFGSTYADRSNSMRGSTLSTSALR